VGLAAVDGYLRSIAGDSDRLHPGLELNYIRNAVKVVIDAYNGTIDFYLADTADPIAATYERIFPGLFKPLAAMPADLQKHIRYPEDLFFIQAQIDPIYHMNSAEIFYNREDLWQFPRQPSGGEEATMASYYIIVRLPANRRPSFSRCCRWCRASGRT
jgi:uncharacterized protein